MKKYILSIVFLLQLWLFPAFAEITRTSTLAPIEAALQKADSETLVIFDVDDVLIHPKDQILQRQNKETMKAIEKPIEDRLTKAQEADLYSLILLKRQNTPVDKRLLELMASLQAKGIKVLGLTNCFTGGFGRIPSMADWRADDLRQVGYDLSKSWQGVAPKRFEGLLGTTSGTGGLSAKNPSPPLYKHGLILTSNVPKGAALKAFLDYAKVTPKKIIFVDDKLKNLKSVESIANDAGIPFEGFEYTAVEDQVPPPLDEARARFQFEVLEKEKTWLSDEEASKRMSAAQG